MIQTQAELLKTQLDERQRLLRERQYLTAFQSRNTHLKQMVNALGETMRSVRVLRHYQIGVGQLQQNAQFLLNLLQEYQQRFASESEWITEQNSLDDLKHKLEGYNKKLADAVNKSWREFVELNLPPLSEDVLQVLERIPSYKNEVALIRRTYREMVEQRERPPRNEGQVQSFLGKREQITDAWGRIGNGEFPEDVLQFLKESSSLQGSPLRLLTPSVYDWLTAHNLLSIFRIRVNG